jgi:hypothetical protein
MGTVFAAPRPIRMKLANAMAATGERRSRHKPPIAVTPLIVRTVRFPNRATIRSPINRLNVIAIEKNMYPKPPRARERRRSPTSSSALQSRRAPSTRKEIAASKAVTRTTPLGIAKRDCEVPSLFESMRGKAKSRSNARSMQLRIVLMLGDTRRDSRAVMNPDPRNAPILKSA